MKPAILPLILLIGCGSPPMTEHEGWEPILRDHALAFEEAMAEANLPTPALGLITTMQRSAALPPDILGYCERYEGSGRKLEMVITVDVSLDEDMLGRVMWHELTHCGYNMNHWGYYGDLMYWQVSPKMDLDYARERHIEYLRRHLEGR